MNKKTQKKYHGNGSDALSLSGDILHVDISWKTFITGLLFVAGVLLAFKIKVVFLLLFISFVLMSTFRPVVKKLVAERISKTWAIVIVYSVVLGTFVALVALISIPIVRETLRLVEQFPALIEGLAERSIWWERVIRFSGIADLETSATKIFQNGFSFSSLEKALSSVGQQLGLLISAVSVLFISAYMTAQWDEILEDVLAYVPRKDVREYLKTLIVNLEKNLGLWFRGWLLHSVTIAGIMVVLFSVFRVPYALPLGVLAGVMEVIPTVGPLVAFIPAIIIAASTGNVWLVVAVVVIYLVVSLIDSNWLTPMVMKKVVGINPLVTLVAILIGAELAGVIGVVLAIPFAIVVQVVLRSIGQYDKTLKSVKKAESSVKIL